MAHELTEEFLLLLNKVVGTPCIGFTAGAGTGSVVAVEFGSRRPRLRPLTNQFLTEDQRLGESEYSLFVECAWRLDSAKEVVCGAWDDNSAGGIMLNGLQLLVGRALGSFRLTEPGFDLELHFDGDRIFKVFCDQVNEHDAYDNYSVFSQQEIFIVGTKSHLRKEERRWATW